MNNPQYYDALAYPFRGNGKWILSGGVLLICLLKVIGAVPVVGGILTLGVSAYFSSLMLDVIRSTANGSRAYEMPEWQMIAVAGKDFFMPLLRITGALIFAFLPMILLDFVIDEAWLMRDPLLALLFIVGIVYSPMAILGVAIDGQAEAITPKTVLPRIWRAMPRYLYSVAVLAVVFFAMKTLASEVKKITHIGWLLSSSMSFYLTIVLARLIGKIGCRLQQLDE